MQNPTIGDYYDEEVEIIELQETNNALMQGAYICLRIGACVWGLGYLAFQVVVVYALSVLHTQAVMETCGVSLWIFLLVHLLLPFVLLCILCCVMLCLYMLTINLMIDAKEYITYYFLTVFLALVYFGVLCGVGAYLTSKAHNNEPCKAAMVSITGTPLLSTLGWVYVALDGADLLLSVVIMIVLGYVHYFLP